MGHKVSPVFWFMGMQRFGVLVAASKKSSWSVENENAASIGVGLWVRMRTGQAVNRIRAVVGKYKKETNKIPN